MIQWGIEAKLPYVDAIPALPGEDTMADIGSAPYLADARLLPASRPRHRAMAAGGKIMTEDYSNRRLPVRRGALPRRGRARPRLDLPLPHVPEGSSARSSAPLVTVPRMASNGRAASRAYFQSLGQRRSRLLRRLRHAADLSSRTGGARDRHRRASTIRRRSAPADPGQLRPTCCRSCRRSSTRCRSAPGRVRPSTPARSTVIVLPASRPRHRRLAADKGCRNEQ